MTNMKNKILGACLCVSAITLANNAAAVPAVRQNWYAGLSGDLTWLKDSDLGGGGQVALGYRFMPTDFGNFRLEGEAGYHTADGKRSTGDTHYISYMGNLYYDFNGAFPLGGGVKVSPYIGGGLGDATVHYGHGSISRTFDSHNNEFAYQGMAGLNFTSPTMPNTDWQFGYRYTGSSGHNVDANSLELGLRYNF